MRADRGDYSAASGYVRVPEGRLYWRSLGRPTAPTLLVVHGGPSEHGYLSVLGDLVPHGYRVVWYDQLGCGRSSRPRSFAGYGVERAAEHTEAVRRALALGRPALFGHSWGGSIALEAVARRPRSYRGLAVSGAFASEASFAAAMRRHLARLPAAIRAPIEAGEARGSYATRRYRDAVQRRRREYTWGMQVLPFDFAATESRINRRLLRAIYGERPGLLSPVTGALRGWDVRPRLGRVGVPVLVLAGEREAGRFTAHELHRLLPRSRVVIVRGAAHLPFLDQRDAFLVALIDFLGGSRRHPGARRGRRSPA